MTDRIDTGKIRGWVNAGVYRDAAAREDLSRLCDEVDRLRALTDPAPVDDRERADHYEAIVLKDWAEDRQRVPEGWRVEWVQKPVPDTSGFISLNGQWEDVPMLVPVSPSVDPEEG